VKTYTLSQAEPLSFRGIYVFTTNPCTMEKIVILTESQLKDVISKTVKQAVKDDKGKLKSSVQKEWLTNKEVCEMLSTTLRTMQNYRDKGVISFSKVGSKLYYRKSDIDSFLESNYHPAFSKERRLS
jgi:excisionase family DNA binding protein